MPNPLNRTTAGAQKEHPERIVQFGGGNFLRAFVDWMVGLLNERTQFSGSVVVVKASPKGMFRAANDMLAAQDGLYHLVLTGVNDGVVQSKISLETSIQRVINPYDEFEAFLALACQPDIRFVVSNTTEAGLTYDPENRFDDDPPANFPAKLTRFLSERYRHFEGDPARGCIIFPVELIEQNGANLLRCVRKYCELWALEPEFEAWLDDANLFCNTLVDRIVPGYPHDRAEALLKEIGFEDALLVEGEQYHSWVIEAPAWVQNEFPAAEAGLNVKFVEDVRPYRDLKVRILNGAHTAMVPVGYLYGLRTVRETVDHVLVGNFISELLFDEVLPTLDAPPAGREQMAKDVLNRFRNPYLKHELITISLNSTSKFRARVLPSLLAYTKQFGRPPKRMTLALTALILFYKGEWRGDRIPVKDTREAMVWWQARWSAASPARMIPEILGCQEIWGEDLLLVEGLQKMVEQYFQLIQSEGIGPALESIYA